MCTILYCTKILSVSLFSVSTKWHFFVNITYILKFFHILSQGFFFFFLACCIMHHFSKTIILVEMRLKLGFKVNIKLHLQPILLLQVCVFEITMIFNKNKTVHQKLHENCHFRCGAIWWWIRKALWKNTPNDQKRVLKKANRFYCDFMLTLEQMSVILITYKQ